MLSLKHRFSSVGWLLALMGLIGCGPTPPQEGPSYDEPLELPVSYWNLPLVLEIEQIEQKINEKVRGTIYWDNSYDNNNEDSIKLRIRKIDKIQLQIWGDRIRWEVPLRVYFDGFVEKKLGRTRLQTYQNTDFAVKLFLESQVGISRDWKLKTETRLVDLLWIEKPRIKLAFLSLTVGRAVEKLLRQKEDELLPRLDQVIRQQVNLRKPIAKAWCDIQKPILINKKIRNIWLMADPQSLEVGAIEGREGQIRIYSRIGLKLYTQVGKRPQLALIKPLPPADTITRQQFPNQFDLNLRSHLSYEHLNEVLKDSLVGRSFEVEGNRLRIDQASCRGAKRQMVLSLQVSGDASGELQFMGIPRYDAYNGVLRVEDFDFDVSSSATVYQAADWVFHEALRASIQSQLVIPLEHKLEQVPELIQQALDKEKVGEKIFVDIARMALTSTQLAIRPEGIELLLRVQGNAGIELERL